jgi:hypothetical protein
MKIFTTITALTLAMLLSAPAMAGSSATVEHVESSSTSQQGNQQGITTTNHGSDLSDAVPAVVAPSLTTTLSETCMGSTSMGIAGAGFGISFGSTWKDDACVRRLDSRELRSFGAGLAPNDAILFHFAAKERMCADPKIRAAFERVYMMTDRKDALCQATADDHVAAQAQRDANKIAGTGNTTDIYYVEDQRSKQQIAMDKQEARQTAWEDRR